MSNADRSTQGVTEEVEKLKKILKEDWSIEPDSPIGKIEVGTSKVLSRLEKNPILMNLEALDRDLAEVDKAIADLQQSLLDLTDGKLKDYKSLNALTAYLQESERIPKSALVGVDLTHELMTLGKVTRFLQEYDPEVADVWYDVRKQDKRRTSLQKIKENLKGDRLPVTFETLRRPSGQVVYMRPNINHGVYGKYFKSQEGKMLIEVIPANFSFYSVATYLKNEELLDIYSSGGTRSLISKVTCIPEDEITSDVWGKFHRFLFGRMFDDGFYPTSTEQSIKNSFSSTGLTEESQRLIDTLLMIEPLKRHYIESPLGRKLKHQIDFATYSDIFHNDLQRAVMVEAEENLKNAELKIIYRGLLLFEVDEDADLTKLKQDIEELYRKVLPSNYRVPTIYVDKFTGR